MIVKKFRPAQTVRRGAILTAVAAFGAFGWAMQIDAQEASRLGGAYSGAPSPQQRNQLLEDGDGQVHALLVRQGDLYPIPEASIYMLVGAGANITMQVGADGILLVNSGKADMSEKVLAAIRAVSEAPIRTIIDTDSDANDSGGNPVLSRRGSLGKSGVIFTTQTRTADTAIIAADQVMDRLSSKGTSDSQPTSGWPTDTYTVPNKDTWLNGESIRIIHQPSAHTDGDSMVFFRHSDVVSTGAIYSTTSYPIFDADRGGSIQGIIDGLNRLIYDVMIPGPQNGGGTLVIPNYGRLSSFSDVVFYQEMTIIVRDRIQSLIKKGMTLAQIEAAKPTVDYDARYGSTTGPWTTNMFVEAVYRSLTRKPTRTRADL